MLALGSAVLTLVAMSYYLGGASGPAVWTASGLAIAGALAGVIVPGRHGRLHAAIAACLMFAVGGFACARVVGHWPFAWDALGDPRYAMFIAAMCFVVGAGVLRGKLWARWSAIAFAAASVLGGSLNAINMHHAHDESAWLAAIGVVGGITILSQLVRPAVRDRFATHAMWSSRDPLVRSARLAAIANFAAAPMLLLYAFGQPIAPATVWSALAIAPILFAGSALVVLRRSAGVLVLAAGAIALVGHTLVTSQTVAVTSNQPVVYYYAAFWLPAALLSLVAAVRAFWAAR